MLIGNLNLWVSNRTDIIQSAQHPPPAPTAARLHNTHGSDLSIFSIDLYVYLAYIKYVE